jgi:alcohol dehydrogenase class IV
MTPQVDSHQISFSGSFWYGTAPDGARSTVVLVEPSLHDPRLEADLLGHVAGTFVCESRPDHDFVARVADEAIEQDVDRVAAIGAGALLDAAKVASRRVRERTDHPVELVLVPCGPEPYRAVARFAVVDRDGERPTVVDERFGGAHVVLVPALLGRLTPPTLACHALDSAVQAIESLLSLLAHPYSRAQATGALRTIAEELPRLGGADDEARVRLGIAAFLAAESFSSTRLGLAHAIASPLGTSLGVTHDTLNGVLGDAVVEFWGADVRGFGEVAGALGVEPTVGAVRSWLAGLREAAGLPASLRELGVEWSNVEAILPRAAESSGIAVLPRPLVDAGLIGFARRGWAGPLEQEEVPHAGSD